MKNEENIKEVSNNKEAPNNNGAGIPETLGTEPYKGVRDFYPEDQAVQNYIFETWRKVVEGYGYEEYNASILEPAELYRKKTSEEIVNEQTYTFIDRGDREVTLRPEMTPTVARMVAGKKRDLASPIRWFSMPNLFRYEKPQRGRLREHWQLNVDIFGIKNLQAETEIISIASKIMKSFGLHDNQFIIKINSRKIINYILNEVFAFDQDVANKIRKLIDKKHKISHQEFEKEVSVLTGDDTKQFITLLNSKNFEEFTNHLGQSAGSHEGILEIRELLSNLEKIGITNTVFDQTLMRGFDYYTGVIFEVFDTNPENKRSLFGGGRYDDLLKLFGGESMPAVGFGMGDVTMRDVLETYKILPTYKHPADLAICPTSPAEISFSSDLADNLRDKGIPVVVDISDKKIGDKIKNADKRKIKYIVCIGQDEIMSGKMKLKDLITGQEKEVNEETLAAYFAEFPTK